MQNDCKKKNFEMLSYFPSDPHIIPKTVFFVKKKKYMIFFFYRLKSNTTEKWDVREQFLNVKGYSCADH